MRVRGPLSQHVQLEPGRWELTLLVAKLDELPTNEAAAAGPWRSLFVRVIISADE